MIADALPFDVEQALALGLKLEFEVTNDVFSFSPRYYPYRVIVGKERNVSEQAGLCEGEDVNDMGPKNRTVTVNGRLTQSELLAFHRLGDLGDPLDLISLPWSGEITVKKTEIEGPLGIDNESREWMYDYTLNLKSTGTDEYGETDHGILATSTGLSDDVVDNIPTSDPVV